MKIRDYYGFDRYGTNARTEVIAGSTTFLATMYIIVVNPMILSAAGMPFSGVLLATVLVSAISSVAMGLYANNPIVLAPGMGINAFFAYTVVMGMKIPWETALGTVFWSGVIFLILSVFGVRNLIIKAIPRQLRYGVAAGIGLFITLIGLINAKFITANPATVIGMGKLDAVTLTFVFGLAVTAALVALRMRGALILGIAVTTLAALPIGRWWGDGTALVSWSGTLLALPDVSLIGRIDFVGSLKFAVWPVIFVFLFTDLFDSLSTFVGVAEAADLRDADGEPRNLKQSMIVDALATAVSGILGTSSGTSYIESAAGVEEGGRTGLTAVVAGLLFLPFMFFSPLLSIVPSIATAPALVMVGVFMMKPVLKINWNVLDDAIPAFLGMILIPLTYSITQGIVWGFLSWTLIKVVTGKAREVTPMLWAIDALAVLSFAIR